MEGTAKSYAFSVVGFSGDRQDDISFAKQYRSDIPDSAEEKSRLIGIFANINYDFNDRYFLDASARLDRSSQFGKLQRGAPFWSFGIGWNLKNDLFENNNIINMLKITANIGTTGSVDIEPYQAFTTYDNFKRKRYVEGMIGSKIMAIGNEHLKWQTTFNRNIGLTSTFFDNLQINLNYYYNTTKNLIIDVALPPSSGFSSFKSNLGELENRGWDVGVNFNLIENAEKNFYVSLFANATHNENKILKIKDYLKNYNDKITENLQKSEFKDDGDRVSITNFDASNNPIFYKEGESLDAVYAVRSFGIDPITGQEVFIKKDGTLTYKWDSEDMVAFGKSTPDINGYFGINITYGRLNANISFGFQTGNTKTYNSTLLDKIENVDLRFNADERVLEKRWEKPGDITFYRKILGPSDSYTRASSRFIEDVGVFTLNSISIDYNPLSEVAIKNLGLRDLRFSINLNDLLRFSTVKQERGLSYPFARTVSFSIQAYF
jgi:hypothetical protein